MCFFFDDYKNIISSYSSFFEQADEEEHNEKPIVKASEGDTWLMWIDKLSNGNGRDWNYFLEMNAIEFLNRLSFLKRKAEFEDAEVKRQLKNVR